MKKIAVLIVLPIFLFALERVNLIKNGSFEEEGVWEVTTGASWVPNPAVGTDKDDSTSVTGQYSASADNREKPTWMDSGLYDSVAVSQSFISTKTFADLDSLFWSQLIIPKGGGSPTTTDRMIIGFTYADPERNGFGYGFINPQWMGVDNWLSISEKISENDFSWCNYGKSLQNDFVLDPKVSPEQELASLVMVSLGVWFNNGWRGQKIHWDDIRLMGYADYDVGIKEILSPDYIGPCESSEQSPSGNSSLVPSYTPVALVKNFGRENAEFAVIAEIYDGETQVYYDSLDWSLTSDTEDTVTFASFTPPDTGTYTLTIRTFMEPDESDADDELTKELDFTGITEHPTPSNLNLNIANTLTSSSPLRVSYSLPANQPGTISIYDPSGRRIHARSVTGSGKIDLNTQLPAGVYIVRLESGRQSLSRKAVLLR
jgi:hypothetical protein